MGGMLGNSEHSGTERNGMEPEVTDAQYGRGHRIRIGKLVLDLIGSRKVPGKAASGGWSYGHDLCRMTYEGIHVHSLKHLHHLIKYS